MTPWSSGAADSVGIEFEGQAVRRGFFIGVECAVLVQKVGDGPQLSAESFEPLCVLGDGDQVVLHRNKVVNNARVGGVDDRLGVREGNAAIR